MPKSNGDLVTNFQNNVDADRTFTVNDTQYESAAYGILEDLLEWNN